MKWIEFIGPSGVGKTFLFNELLKKRSKNDKWISPDEGLWIVYKEMLKNNQIDYKRRCFNTLRSAVLGSQYNPIELFPNDNLNAFFANYGNRFNFLSEIAIRGLANESNIESKTKIKFLSWYFKNRLMRFIILSSYSFNSTIVFDDGVIHTNFGVRSFNEYSKYVSTKNQIIYPDAIVNLKANSDIIFERVKIRKKNNNIQSIMHRNLNEKELLEFIKRSIVTKKKDIDVLRNKTKFILDIDTTDSIGKNCSLIGDFIRALDN